MRIGRGLQSWMVTVALTVLATTGVVAMGNAWAPSGLTAPTSVATSAPVPTPSTSSSASSATSPAQSVSLTHVPSGSGNDGTGDGGSGG